MNYYQVQIWMESSQEWVNIKQLMFIYGRPVVDIDSKERLTRAEAETRHGLLSRKHQAYTFRIADLN
ncbi:hypothetical protein GCM10028816_52760 [Spirosoma lituiforme]